MGGAWEPGEGASSVENEGEGLWWSSELEVDGVSSVAFGVNLCFEERGVIVVVDVVVGFVVFKVAGSGDGSGHGELKFVEWV